MDHKTFWAVFWAIIAVQVTNVIFVLLGLTFVAALGRTSERNANETFQSVATELAP